MTSAQLPVFAPTLTGFCLVAVGGALGAVARYQVSLWIGRLCGRLLPWGTLGVNLSAALMAGIFLALFNQSDAAPAGWLLWVVGLLGGYSTVSSFSLQMLVLAQDGPRWRAPLYLLCSVLGCLSLVALGYALGFWLWSTPDG